MLLTHEVRLKSAYSNVTKEATLNFVANLAQGGNNQKQSGKNVGWNANNQGNWNENYVNKSRNDNYNNNGGFGSGRCGYREQNSRYMCFSWCFS